MAGTGNSNVGSGRMEILEAENLDAPVPSKILIKLDFFKPFEGHNTAEFTMRPEGDGTHVNWAMRGPAPFMSKLMQVFMNLDRMIGKDFEVRPRQSEEAHGEVKSVSEASLPRSKRCKSVPICSSTAIAKRRSNITRRCWAPRSRCC